MAACSSAVVLLAVLHGELAGASAMAAAARAAGFSDAGEEPGALGSQCGGVACAARPSRSFMQLNAEWHEAVDSPAAAPERKARPATSGRSMPPGKGQHLHNASLLPVGDFLAGSLLQAASFLQVARAGLKQIMQGREVVELGGDKQLVPGLVISMIVLVVCLSGFACLYSQHKPRPEPGLLLEPVPFPLEWAASRRKSAERAGSRPPVRLRAAPEAAEAG
eukprot:CAMPEP_0179091392 /NCGR_PEP_ID=MMETSP0796-20121207/41747_1 /TAXON_ID=73915 /ORGANISM="Pyrodinium bahamense, Strain pbaha01" /LENGTH=220 /DNA_ID=CAMNT_0020788983 /DNA_START=74 /DNA_END=732 /DNA_ORIENTATION=+